MWRFIVSQGSRFAAVAMLWCIAGAVQSHHSSTPHFDESRQITLTGVVTSFKMVNPHAYLYFDVTGSDGKVEHWNCEMAAVAILARNGMTRQTVVPGDKVTIKAFPAWRDPHGCSFVALTARDGTTYDRFGVVRKEGVVTNRGPGLPQAVVPTARTFSGNWVGGGGPPKEPVNFDSLLTPAGKAALAKYDVRYDDPGLRCSPASILRAWGEPFEVTEITQTPETITIRHEYMDTVRVVDMRTRSHPAKIKPSLTGHSVGWFEGDTLVIETVGFPAGVLMPNPALLHSEQMKMIERLNLSADGSQLTRSYEVTDPKYFKEPLTVNNFPCLWTCKWNRTTTPRTKYTCTELAGLNNRRPKAAP